MDFNATIDLIIKDLNETRDIIDDLKKYPGVPVLQIELAKSKCKSAGEVIALIKTLKDFIPAENVVPVQPQPHIKPESQARPVLQPKPQPEPRPESQPKTEPLPQPQYQSKPKPRSKSQSQVQVKLDDTPIIADKFVQPASSFHDQLRSKEADDNLSDKLILKPISNLSEAIGVNDRFLFIREIFNEDNEAYLQAISRLDNATSLTDARAVIMSYTGDNLENDAVTQLLELVKLKLSSNE